MPQEITDAMLVRVATDSALKYMGRLGMEYKSSAFTGYLDATRTALEVERDSYYVLKEALSIAMRDASEHEDPSLYVMRLRAQIDRLRTRLGITE